jgi:2-dehydro-3-deoxyphosphogalactonate aldolase
MLKALQAVLPKDTMVIPVGGIDAEKIAPWMAAGASGVGVGSSLYRPGDTPTSVEAKAKVLMDVIQAYRTSSEAGKL